MPTLQRIGSSHCAALAELFRRNNIPSVLRFFHPFPLDEQEAERIACHTGKDRYYLLVKDDEARGFSMLRGWDEGFSVPSLGMMVDVDGQGKGLGRELLLATLAEARALGCPQVRLSVYADNGKALKLYQSVGFELREKKEVAFENEKRESLILVLDLDKAS